MLFIIICYVIVRIILSSYVVVVIVVTNVSTIPLSPSYLPRPTEKRCRTRTRTMTTTLWGKPRLPLVTAAAGSKNLPMRPPHRAVVPTHLCCLCRHRRHRRPHPKTPLAKSAQRDLQEIASVLSRFRVSVIIVFRCDVVAIVALPILLPNQPRRHQLLASTSSRLQYSSPPSPPRRPPSSRQSSGGGSHLPG